MEGGGAEGVLAVISGVNKKLLGSQQGAILEADCADET
jgi:hypothetical protein